MIRALRAAAALAVLMTASLSLAQSNLQTTAPASATKVTSPTNPSALAAAGPEGDLDLTFRVVPVGTSCSLQTSFTYYAEPPAKATVRWYQLLGPAESMFYNHDGGWIELTHAGVSRTIYSKSCVGLSCTVTYPTGANGQATTPWLYSTASPLLSPWSARESSHVDCNAGGGSWTVRVHWRLVDVSVSPSVVQLLPSGTRQLSAAVSGTASGSVTWRVVEAGGGTVSSTGLYTAPAVPGTYHVEAKSTFDTSRTATSTVTVAPPVVTVSVSPGTATVLAGTTRQFTASVAGTANTAVTWSVQEGAAGGTVTSSGLYTPPSAAGTYHVVATSVQDPSKTAIATVTVPNVSVAISPSSWSSPAGGTKQFSATVLNAGSSAVTWSVVEGAAGGSVTPTGLYTAPVAAGTYHVTATSVVHPGRTATATVTVSEVLVAISPATLRVFPAQSTQFNATVVNAANASVSWSVLEGAAGGTVTATGLYTAPAAPGTYHVVARSVLDPSKSATATAAVYSTDGSIMFAGAGSFSGAGRPGVPSAYATGDLLVVVTAGDVATPAGWTRQVNDATLGIFWKRAALNEVPPDFGPGVACQMAAYRGVVPTGSPFEVTGSVAATQSPQGEYQDWWAPDAPSITTRTVGNWVLHATGMVVTDTYYSEAQTYALNGPAPQTAFGMSAEAWGNLGVVGLYHGLRTTTGATGNATTACWGYNDRDGNIRAASVLLALTPEYADGISVTVTPESPTIVPGSTLQFSALVTGTPDVSVQWTVSEGAAGGWVSSTGLYTAPAVPGTYHVVATSVADASRKSVATVRVDVGVEVTVTPSSAALVTNETWQFSAQVTGTSNPSVSWRVAEGTSGGTVTAAGLYRAPSVAGTYHLIATSLADPSRTATATITVSAYAGSINFAGAGAFSAVGQPAVPPTYAAGDLLVVVAVGSATTPVGWTRQVDSATLRLFWKRAVSNEAAPDFGQGVACQMAAYRGVVVTGSPFEVTGPVAATQSPQGSYQDWSAPSAPSITTLSAGAWVLYATGLAVTDVAYSEAATYTPGTGPATSIGFGVAAEAWGSVGVVGLFHGVKSTPGATGSAPSAAWGYNDEDGYVQAASVLLALTPAAP